MNNAAVSIVMFSGIAEFGASAELVAGCPVEMDAGRESRFSLGAGRERRATSNGIGIPLGEQLETRRDPFPAEREHRPAFLDCGLALIFRAQWAPANALRA